VGRCSEFARASLYHPTKLDPSPSVPGHLFLVHCRALKRLLSASLLIATIQAGLSPPPEFGKPSVNVDFERPLIQPSLAPFFPPSRYFGKASWSNSHRFFACKGFRAKNSFFLGMHSDWRMVPILSQHLLLPFHQFSYSW